MSLRLPPCNWQHAACALAIVEFEMDDLTHK